MADAAELHESRKRIRLLEQESEVLRRAAAYLSQANLPIEQTSRSSVRWLRPAPGSGRRIRLPVAVACRVLGLSRQGYYQWLADPGCQRGWDDAHAIDALLDIHADDPTLGYRFLTDELGDVTALPAITDGVLHSITRPSSSPPKGHRPCARNLAST